MEKIVIHTDGGARGNPGHAGIGAVLRDGQGNLVGELSRYIGQATNNFAEYQALIEALKEAAKTGAGQAEIYMDSELIVRQMQGRYKIKEPALQVLAGEVLRLVKSFKQVSFHHIRRELNKEADKLVNMAIDRHLNERQLSDEGKAI